MCGCDLFWRRKLKPEVHCYENSGCEVSENRELAEVSFEGEKGEKSRSRGVKFLPVPGSVILSWMRWRGRKIAPSDTNSEGIQELDNGFFEKFGTELFLKQNASVCESSCPQDGDSGVGEEITPNVSIEDIDSDHEESNKDKFITDAFGWNIEELYSEVLYEILHNVGCDVESSEEQTEIINYLQQAFHLEDEKHNLLLETVKEKEAPNILLNVEVIEAKDLKPKDCNGLSDPFCTLYLNSSPMHRYNTSVKSETLSPVWEEHFSLPVQNPAEDVLWVEVWDFDPAETVREKMTKICDVKGVKGFSKLIKEIAVTASTGKHDNELVGATNIPLRAVPASGQTYWLHLEKKTKTKKRGNVKVKLSFSSEKNSQVSLQEYRHLLRLLLLHELENTKVEPYRWSGNFSSLAKDILTQHIAQSGLTTTSVALAQWAEFTTVHLDHPFSFALFKSILFKLSVSMNSGNLREDEIKLFWETTKKLLPSCINYIRKIRKLPVNDKKTYQQMSYIVEILSQLNTLQVPEEVELFSKSVYGWLSEPSKEGKFEIKQVVIDAIIQGASDWYNHIIDNNTEENTLEDRLRLLIRVVQLIRTDIQRALESYEKLFQEGLQFSYSRVLYELYEEKVSGIAEDEIVEACKLLKPISFKRDFLEHEKDTPMLSMGTTLFELYLCLQRFAILGTGLCPEGSNFRISKFHLWFHRGVAQWLDIALFKAMQRIEKAAELDNLKPVDHTVKYSSSAVDTLAIFYQIKIFWKQLAWPDIEGSYTFIAKIIDDICRCCIFYADKMTEKVEGLGDRSNPVYEEKFEVTPEWCLAINNIDYVRNSIPTFAKELGLDDIIKALADFQNPSAADHCKQTLLIIVDNAIETVGNKILDLQDTVVRKMSPSIYKFLMEGAELLHQESNSLERLMQYLDESLITLNSQLNEDNFQMILNIIWETVASLLRELVDNSLEKRRPPNFFSNLSLTLQILKNFFKKTEEGTSKDGSNKTLKIVEHKLNLHALETWELIHQYNLERFREQQKLETAELGIVTVRAHFIDNLLKVEILSARNLHPKDSNGACDPYVKICLLPEEKFTAVPKPRTKTQKKTVFPLFDEVFSLPLSAEQRNLSDGLVHFIIKDQDFLGNEFLGESFLDFGSIPSTDSSVSVHSLPQVHLKLSRPSRFESEAFKALEHRQGDKLARDFIKKQKAKAPN